MLKTKMLKTKIKTLITALILTFQILIPANTFADFLNVRAYGNDTVAGYASVLKTSLINPGQNVTFVIEKPDMSVVRVPAQADLEGVAQTDLYGHQTKIAGEYKISVVFPGSPDSSPQSGFDVFPGPLSVTQSNISSTNQMLSADGKEKTFITISLYDDYRNPIKNHAIQLISSRMEDEITALSGGVTDEQGNANFKILSKYSGVSVYTALDATLNKVLSDREEIVFFEPTETNAFGGNYLSADLLGADITTSSSGEVLPGPVHHFDIEDIPFNVKINTDQTVTVTARDKDGNVAKNYTGTILISTPDDDNAVLPNNGEYTFKESDRGKFTFNLALRFSKTGNQTIQVLDKDNWKISGEYKAEVIPEQSVPPFSVSSTLSIKSPADGAKLGNSLVILTGQGDTNINLKVFDNDIKMGESETDSDGFFTYQAQNLINGDHIFYVMSDDGDVSASVRIHIDTMPPVLNYAEIYPDGTVESGALLTISIQSEPDLESAKIRIQGIEEILTESDAQPGTYTAEVAAPVNNGEYSIDVILVDSLSNKAEFLNKIIVSVNASSPANPPNVENPEGEPGDGQVSLTWDEVTDHETGIQNYRIYYGTDYDAPDKIVDTDDNTGSIVISDLENDKQYFFSIRAVDSKAIESEEPSITIAVTPIKDDPYEDQLDNSDNVLSDDIFGSFTGGSYSPDSVTLSWEVPFGIQPYFYKVYFGLNSKRYDDYEITPDSTPSITIRDLISGIPYYFSVTALDLTGREISPLSDEFSVTPGVKSVYGGLHSVSEEDNSSQNAFYNPTLKNSQLTKAPENGETGPETVWIIIISLLCAHFVYHHKRRITKGV